MIGAVDTYYQRREVSNSDLLELHKYFLPYSVVLDLEAAYRFGNLVDAMITEPLRCDHLRYRVDDEQFGQHEWEIASKMRSAFHKDSLSFRMLQQSKGQAVKTKDLLIDFEGFEFTLPMRCKYDLWSDILQYGGDIKSTIATTQKQFEDAFFHFDYDQSRALYMDISGANQDLVIGISKLPPHKIFKIYIKRGDAIYTSGKEKYSALAFKWWYLFENTEAAA